jgi:hypothetical protein
LPAFADNDQEVTHMARTTSMQTALKAESTNLMAALLAELKSLGIEPKVKWAPSKSYASLYVDGKNIGYVFKQTGRGMRIEPAAAKADLPKGAKGWKPGTRSALFALVGQVTTEAEAKAAAKVLRTADAKRAAVAAEK